MLFIPIQVESGSVPPMSNIIEDCSFVPLLAWQNIRLSWQNVFYPVEFGLPEADAIIELELECREKSADQRQSILPPEHNQSRVDRIVCMGMKLPC